MDATQIRDAARALMNEQIGVLILAFLLYSIMLYITGSMLFLGAIVIYGPLSYGAAGLLLKLMDSQKIDATMIFGGFEDFARTLTAGLLVALYTFLWSLLLIIPGIVAAYSYSMTFFILQENPEMNAQEAITASKNLMMGKKWQLFDLHLSFIGWIVLCILSFGLASIYVNPYIATATAVFYADIKQQQSIPSY